MDLLPIARWIPAQRLQAFSESAFERLGCPSADAQQAAGVLVWASLRGIDTHGIRNLYPYYLRRIQTGEVNPQPTIEVQRETPIVARIDGGAGLGLVTAGAAMRLAMQKADDAGVGMVTVANSHHLGPAGYFASLGLDRQMLGICASGHFFAQGNPVGVTPINSVRAMFSTNPISFAAPAGTRPAFVMDMATAATTVNRIEMFGQAGKSIPAGWAKDAAGNPTTDPAAALLVNSLGGDRATGGHKGVALSMMVSILTGVLSGGWKSLCGTGSGYQQTTMGHFLAAFRIDQFMPIDQFTESIDAMLESIDACPPMDESQSVHYPGSQEHKTIEIRSRDGIPIDERLLAELEQLRDSLSIPVAL